MRGRRVHSGLNDHPGNFIPEITRPRLALSVLKKIQVPLQAPDSIPGWMYSDTNVAVAGSEVLASPFTKRIVVVQFQKSATLAQREAAITAVNGTVVGGIRIPGAEGHYYVRIEDVTGATLLSAAAQLRAMPQVAGAFVNVAGSVQYRNPNDGAGWHRDAWKILPIPSNYTNENWALTAINAPLAWGCDTGSAITRVAVVDVDFRQRDAPGLFPDLQGMSLRTGDGSLKPKGHGTAVAGLLAATGGNDEQVAGVMWNSDTRLYDFSVHQPSVLQDAPGAAWASAITAEVERAAYDDARVINISAGVFYGLLPKDGGTPQHQNSRDEMSLALFTTMNKLKDAGYFPLVVVSAGNDAIDASWNGFPLVRSSFPDQILTVGGTDRSGGFWHSGPGSGSNTGIYVDVVAPGKDVFVLDPSGGTRPDSGTSFSAPLVSGIAGLLFSFDPDLTAGEVRKLILDGAQRANRTVIYDNRTYYQADAYESLKLAAETSGRPLCGNRLWSDGAKIWASRGESDTEDFFAFGESQYGIMELAAHHGGRRIDFLNSRNGERRAITLSGHTWSEDPGVLSDTGSISGVWRSLYGYSHDGSQEVFVDNTTFNEGAGPVVLKRWDGTSIVPVPGSVTISPPLQHPDTGCAWKLGGADGPCAFLLTGVDENAYVSYTFSPIGDRAIAGYSVWKTTTTVNGGFSPCPWSEPDPETGEEGDHCAESITVVSEPVRAAAYTFPLAGGGVTPLFSLTGSVIGTMEMTEDGFQVIVQEGMEVRRSTGRPGGCGESNPTGWCNGDPETVTPTGCQITYRSTVTGAPVTTIPTRQACINGGIGSAAASIGRIEGARPLKVPSFLKVPPRPPSR